MMSILLIGVASALLICAITAIIIGREPKKANKAQKAEIMKELLALSDCEHRISSAASDPRMGSLPKPSTRAGNGPRKATARISPPLRTR